WNISTDLSNEVDNLDTKKIGVQIFAKLETKFIEIENKINDFKRETISELNVKNEMKKIESSFGVFAKTSKIFFDREGSKIDIFLKKFEKDNNHKFNFGLIFTQSLLIAFMLGVVATYFSMKYFSDLSYTNYVTIETLNKHNVRVVNNSIILDNSKVKSIKDDRLITFK
ncbi:MAG: hypothetical protein U9N59_10835, partial [Campylobacterota bacterium]|nr:hypothetical protein [Campylobacterota bacterium]